MEKAKLIRETTDNGIFTFDNRNCMYGECLTCAQRRCLATVTSSTPSHQIEGSNDTEMLNKNRSLHLKVRPLRIFSRILIVLSTIFLLAIILKSSIDVYIRYVHGDCTGHKKSQKIDSRMYFADGVFWSQEAEALAPMGYAEKQTREWNDFIRDRQHQEVVYLRADVCGREGNRLAIFSDGSRACIRYRINLDQMAGEAYGRVLAQLLRIAPRHLPPSSLLSFNQSSALWSRVKEEAVAAGWKEGRPISVTKFERGLTAVPVPKLLWGAELPGVHAGLTNLTSEDVTQLIQWSDLILFDYLTGNQDRFVSMLINRQWNSAIMSYPAHNLAKSTRREGLLVFLDHEAALFHGYRLLERYQNLHLEALQRFCVFRWRTIDALRGLSTRVSSDLEKLLLSELRKEDGNVVDLLPPLTNQNAELLLQRIQDVLNHVESCKNKFNQ